mgnify:FL=1
MHCFDCGAEMLVTREPHRYGDDINVVLQNVEVRRCPVCGDEEVVIPRIEELNRSIAGAIAGQDAALSPGQIRFLRTYLGLSSVRFAELMGVKPETVSRWERTDKPQRMSPTAERLLRVLVQNEQPVESYALPATDAAVRERDARMTFCCPENGWPVAGAGGHEQGSPT